LEVRNRIVIFLIGTVLLFFHEAVIAQKVTLSGKKMTIAKVFSAIEKQTGYTLIYSDQQLDIEKKLDVRFKDVKLEDAIRFCLEKQQMDFVIDSNMIIIRSAGQISHVNKKPDLSSNVIIKGRVVNEKGEPMPGTTISVKNSLQKFIANEQGEFSLLNVKKKSILQLYCVGFATKELPIQILIDNPVITLVENPTILNEVSIISTGYQKFGQEQLTGAISTMNKSTYETSIVTNNFLDGVQNKLSGLLINRDIVFEGNTLLQIRGVSTLTASKQPLIVLDGYPTELTSDAINPNEIESVSILKDAAAAAIYGARSSNGVVVVERKKGGISPVIVNFRSSWSISPKVDYSNSRFAPYSLHNSFISNLYPQTFNEDYFKSIPVTYWPGIEPFLLFNSQKTSAAEMQKRMLLLYNYNNTEDYTRFFKQQKRTNQYDLNFSGGSHKISYFLSLDFTGNQKENVKSYKDRVLISGRGNYKFNDKLSLVLSTDVFQIKEHSVPVPDLTNTAATEVFKDAMGNPAAIYAYSYVNPIYNVESISNGYQDNLNYPLRDINEVYNLNLNTSNRILAELNYNLFPGLKLKLGGVYEHSKLSNSHYASAESSEVKQFMNLYSTMGPDGKITFNFPGGDYVRNVQHIISSYTIRAQLDYRKNLGQNHSINLIAGAEIRKVNNEGAVLTSLGNKNLSELPSTNSAFPFNPVLYPDSLLSATHTNDKYISFYLNQIYAYKAKYLLSFSLRVDQGNLNLIQPQNNAKPFWSVGLAWNMEKEKFMQSLSWLKSLKVRGSLGYNGNISKSTDARTVIGKTENPFIPPQSMALGIQSMNNSALQWEKTFQFNTGLDFSILGSINGSLDYYIKNSKGLIGLGTIDPTKGSFEGLYNHSSILNKGVELTLNSYFFQTKKNNWNVGITYSYNKSAVLDVYLDKRYEGFQIVSQDGRYSSSYISGYSIDPIFSYRFAGLNSSGIPIAANQTGQTGPFSFFQGKGLEPLIYSGSRIPRHAMGLSNRVGIGPFNVYIMVDIYAGLKTRIPRANPYDFRPLIGAENYYRSPGDELRTDVIGLSPGNGQNVSAIGNSFLYNYSDKYVINGAYLLLREATISYRFNMQGLKRLGFKKIEVKAQGSNLFTKGFNRYNYSLAVGEFYNKNMIPTFTLGLLTSF
jgi:TonB-linked SusC/RagA family outer membrane protein